MVDFKKRLAKSQIVKPINPIELYETLDRASDKGALRPAQSKVLEDWFEQTKTKRDLIVKLHTGQGKTLVGLLMLQARLNSESGPCVYLCPDNFLIKQTREQAKQFGILTCEAVGDLPDDFIDGKAVLVTSVQKLFNGMTKFGLWNNFVSVGTVLMDDAHACADRIRSACTIKIPKSDGIYGELKTLFAESLEQQGQGTFADISNGKRDAILQVPYWTWLENTSEVASILSKGTDKKHIKFSWPLLKDMLERCQCVVSGQSIEIEPYAAPLDAFGSYYNADRRIFMSATVTDDAFLVKGLELSKDTISNPLTFDEETWSGEKMVILPTLINNELDSDYIRRWLGKERENSQFGIVSLVPSFAVAEAWENNGAKKIDKDTIGEDIAGLKAGSRDKTFVLVNRYDGVDLPDRSCRILIFDSLPFSESLVDLFNQQVRPSSESVLIRTVRTIEQGMGRSVRGEKDFSVIILTGASLVRLLRDSRSRSFLSPQVAKQIEIGLEVSGLAREEVESGELTSGKALSNLVSQSLQRDEGWKAFYKDSMDGIHPTGPNQNLLTLFEAEQKAEHLFAAGQQHNAGELLQAQIDSHVWTEEDNAWLLQEKARYLYAADRLESQKIQVVAHGKNRRLLKPPTGVSVARLNKISLSRTEAIINWVSAFSEYAELNVAVAAILEGLHFGVSSDRFEASFDELAKILGFASERPDKHWKEGPDNLWALDDNTYLLVEAKNEVKADRSEIHKTETEQMNRSAAWFKKYYPTSTVNRWIIHPSKKIASAGHFIDPVVGVSEAGLKQLRNNCTIFFKGFENKNLQNLSASSVQSMIDATSLSADSLKTKYHQELKLVRTVK